MFKRESGLRRELTDRESVRQKIDVQSVGKRAKENVWARVSKIGTCAV